MNGKVAKRLRRLVCKTEVTYKHINHEMAHPNSGGIHTQYISVQRVLDDCSKKRVQEYKKAYNSLKLSFAS